MIKRTTMISLRVDNNDLDDLEKNIKSVTNPNGKFNNVSECIRELAKVGHKVMEYQEMMKDPEKKNEFVNKMQEMTQSENFSEFSQTLSTEQLDGFLMHLQMEKEKRYDQKTFNQSL